MSDNDDRAVGYWVHQIWHALQSIIAGGVSYLNVHIVGPLSGAGNVRTMVNEALPSGENHVGQVGGHITTITMTPIVSSGVAYATGDNVGALMQFAGAARVTDGHGVVHTVTLTDLGKQDIATDVIIFSQNPTATTFTDNSPMDIADADLPKICGIVKIAASDYSDFNDNSAACIRSAGVTFDLVAGNQTLYACLVTRGAPTYTSTSDITLKLGILQD